MHGVCEARAKFGSTTERECDDCPYFIENQCWYGKGRKQCIVCHVDIDNSGRSVRCPECQKEFKNKVRRDRRKKESLERRCKHCNKNIGNEAPLVRVCPECKEKHQRLRAALYYYKYPENTRKYCLDYYNRHHEEILQREREKREKQRKEREAFRRANKDTVFKIMLPDKSLTIVNVKGDKYYGGKLGWTLIEKFGI